MIKKEFKKKPYYNIYKPLSKADSGCALQFSYDPFKGAIFLEAARQRGARLAIGSKEQFDWKNKIVFKIGTTDIGTLLLLFNGRKTEVECFHSGQDKSHSSVLKISKQTGDYDNYRLQLTRTDQGEDGKSTKSVSIYIDHHEMVLLGHFFRESLTRMLGFSADADISCTERQLDALIEILLPKEE
jgi:hypothetical protein